MRAFVLLPALLSTTALASLASAQETIVLDTVVVEAQRREQALVDVPASVRVLDRTELEDRIVRRLEDAFQATPNVDFKSERGGYDASNISIRGVSSTSFGTDPAVAVYIDDVYIGGDANLAAPLTDLDQIEILRGPQGTLYGRGALGGAVNIRTGRPTQLRASPPLWKECSGPTTRFRVARSRTFLWVPTPRFASRYWEA